MPPVIGGRPTQDRAARGTRPGPTSIVADVLAFNSVFYGSARYPAKPEKQWNPYADPAPNTKCLVDVLVTYTFADGFELKEEYSDLRITGDPDNGEFYVNAPSSQDFDGEYKDYYRIPGIAIAAIKEAVKEWYPQMIGGVHEQWIERFQTAYPDLGHPGYFYGWEGYEQQEAEPEPEPEPAPKPAAPRPKPQVGGRPAAAAAKKPAPAPGSDLDPNANLPDPFDPENE